MLIEVETKHDPASPLQVAKGNDSARRIAVSRDDMIELFDYLEDGLVSDACDHSFKYTEAFLASRDIAQRPALEWIRGFGATCDCEILQNVELEWGGPL